MKFGRHISGLFAVLAIGSCTGAGTSSSETEQDRGNISMDSVGGATLTDKDLKENVWRGLSGNAEAQMRIAEHLAAEAGDIDTRSLGWFLASAEAENPIAVQALISYLTSEGNSEGCELAQNWYDRISDVAQRKGTIEAYFASKQVQEEYFAIIREQIDNCKLK